MKKILLTSGLIASVLILFAQKQTHTWYFGNKVGLDFNYSPPIPLNNGNANSQEGSAVMSDNNGQLLFYTNGISVQNRKHEIMVNGNGLMGDLSSTNNVVIVPKPGADSMYYIFATGSARVEEPKFSYSVVDMKADGGYGAVVEKNTIIADGILEKLAAIRHCNNRDVWIVVQKWNTDQYYAYLVTSAGISAPVVSSMGLVITGQVNNAIGTLKFTSKGNKLAACHAFDNDLVQLMDFDNTTGMLSNPITFKPNTMPHQSGYTGIYGAEFSPDGRLLYVSANNSLSDPSTLYQFDISSHDPAVIIASKQTIAQTTPWFAGALQLGPDKKIYMAMWEDSSISVIENPNVYGAGCNFVFNKMYLGPVTNSIQFGLPTIMQSYFDSTANPFDFSRTGACSNLNVSFVLSRLNGIDSVKWEFGDGQQSQVLQPTHTYAAPGFYDVKLIVYKVDCSGLNDTATRKIWIAGSGPFLGTDTSSCNLINLEIGVDQGPGINYLWNTGANSSRITTANFGTYWLEMEQNGCKVRDSILVFQKPKPTVNLGPDTSICKYKPVLLKTASANYDTYTWSTGETTPTITADKIGSYYVTVTKDGCLAADTVKVVPGDCDVYIPSAFTPNNDNLNETFGVIDNVALQYFSMQIYSKWGELIFMSNDVTQKWDGKFKGKNMPNGSYLWMVTYVKNNGRRYYEQGTVMLIR